MPVAGSKPSVNEEVIRYQARTKLADLAEEIAKSRKLKSPEILPKIKKATMIRLWLKALDYKEYLTREQRERIWYALIEIAGINDFPLAPILELRTKPDILSGGTTTTTVVNSQSSDGQIAFANSDIDTGTEVVDSFARSLSPGAEWHYVARKNDGTAVKTGHIQTSWLADGSDVAEPTEWGTTFAGVSATDVTLSVVHNAGNIELRATVTSNDWTVEGFRKHIPTSTGVTTSNALAVGNVIVGNAQAIATAVDTAVVGDILADVTNGLTIKAGAIVNADINAAAGIAYSKLSLANSIVNADIATGAAIAYSKLSLAGSIVNADISTSAAIAVSKLAALSASLAVVTDASGKITTVAGVTTTKVGFLANVTSDLQTQIDSRVADTGGTMTGALINTSTIEARGGIRTASSGVYLKEKVVDIGDWDMDLNDTKAVPHGIADYKKIRGIDVVIRDDADTVYSSLERVNIPGGSPQGGFIDITSTNINLFRTPSGQYDSTTYNATAFNRGYVLITYEA